MSAAPYTATQNQCDEPGTARVPEEEVPTG
jgi:hypothetical protein